MKRILLGLLVMVACDEGGSAKPDAAIDAPVAIDALDAPIDMAIDAPSAMPMGDHHRYVVDRQVFPETNTEARDSGLDLTGDDVVDNQLGMVLATLDGQGLDFAPDATQLVDTGSVVMLVDVQTSSFTTASNAGFTSYAGTTTFTPPACTGPNDVVCRQHFAGTGAFTVDATAPTHAPLVGSVTSTTLTTPIGAGRLPVSVPLFGGITLDLIGARVKLASPTATRIVSGIIAGGVTMADLDTKIYPGMQVSFTAQVAEDCTPPGTPPGCGCADSSTGKQLLALFDASHDCAITVEEIKNNSLILSLFAPDVTIGGEMALSIGFKFDAVPGTFTP